MDIVSGGVTVLGVICTVLLWVFLPRTLMAVFLCVWLYGVSAWLLIVGALAVILGILLDLGHYN